jgi:hypothetical protein
MAEGITCMLLSDRLTFDLTLEISDRKETSFRDMIRGNVALLTGMLPLLNAIKAANIPQAIDISDPFIMV